ncbi:MAG: ABC transporter substrate-binding protein [Planctomycetia bacterium]|nr:ABC transporter substrate-binding protein [Planctomycetia bacterium]
MTLKKFFTASLCTLPCLFLFFTLTECQEISALQNPKEENTSTPHFILGDLAIKRQKKLGFIAPSTLEELEKQVTAEGGWIENALRDGEELVYNYVNRKPAMTSVSEARKMVNDFPDSEKANEIIQTTLCRMPDSGPASATHNYEEVDYNAEMSRHLRADAKTFNPLLYSTMYEAEVQSLIGINLFSFTYDTFEPYATSDTNVSWHTSANRLIDKVVMRDDMTWSDGKPVTAYDVEFSFKVIMSSMVPVVAVRSGTDLLVDVKAYDERTVVFFHEKAMPINVFNMLFPIIPKHIYENTIPQDPTLTKSEIHVELEKNPVVAGAYVIESRKRDFEIILKRREGSYMHNGKQVRSKPFFQRVRFRISPEPASALMRMNRGDIEIMQLTPEQWTTQTKSSRFTEKNTKTTSTEWAYQACWWNLEEPFFKERKVREALYYAIDYDTLLNINRHGLDRPCLGVASEDSPWFPKNANIPAPRQDQDLARKLLDEAGWRDDDKDGIREKIINGKKVKFSFTLLVANSPDNIPLSMLIETSLREIGISCRTVPLEWTVLIDNMQKKKFQAAISGWGAGADPYTLRNVWATGEARNNIGYSNKEVDRLFDEGELEFDRQKRMAIYQKIHMLIYDDIPCLWLFCRNSYYGFNKDIRGLGFYPRGPIYGTAWKEAVRTP